MPQTLDFADLGEGIGNATAVLRNNAASAGLEVAVPSRPGWTMADLVVAQGRSHRLATAALRGEPAPTQRAIEAEVRATPDLLQWLDDGMVELLNALAAAAEGRRAWFHAGEAPADRQAAARRLCHDATVHAVDGMAARLGRLPGATEVWFSPALARDGIDWMLQREAARPPTGVLRVTTDDDASEWTVGTRADGPGPAPSGPQALISGSARAIYLALAGRGDDLRVSGDRALVDVVLARVRTG